MSCLRANPLTGEMIDGDVVFDAELHPLLEAGIRPAGRPHTTAQDGEQQTAPLAIGEVISPILASKMGYGQPQTQPLLGIDALGKNPTRMVPEVVPADPDCLSWDSRGTSRADSAASASSRPDSSATSAWPRSPWPTATGPDKPAADKEKDEGQGSTEEARAQARAARRVSRVRRSSTS